MPGRSSALSLWKIANPKSLETGLRTITAGIPYTFLLLGIEAIGFPPFGLLLCTLSARFFQQSLNPNTLNPRSPT